MAAKRCLYNAVQVTCLLLLLVAYLCYYETGPGVLLVLNKYHCVTVKNESCSMDSLDFLERVICQVLWLLLLLLAT
jgi:hypothetical protein